jgi:hypothetical protein
MITLKARAPVKLMKRVPYGKPVVLFWNQPLSR